MKLFPLLFCLALMAQETTVGPDAVVLTVYGHSYTRAEFEEIVKAQRADPKVVAARITAANSFGRVQALAEEARRRGLDKDPELKAKIAMYEGSMLNQALFKSITAEIHADESLARKRYETTQNLAEERSLRQILIRHTKSKTAGKLTPEQALAKIEDLRKKLVGGANFAALASEQSDDPLTKAKGGDMNYVRKPMLVPEFGAVAFQLKKGELSEVVKTSDGYHLIRVEDIAPPKFEVVRKAIEYDLARERMDAMTVSGIKLNPDYFGK